MTIQTVTDAIRYVGVDDNTLALFENQYPVQPMGVSYNSYVILDEKIAVMDSVDARAAEEWLSNVARVLEGRLFFCTYCIIVLQQCKSVAKYSRSQEQTGGRHVGRKKRIYTGFVYP